MDIWRYRTVGGWFESARAKGYSVPLQACMALDQTMKKLNLSLADAYELLMKKKKLILVGKVYIAALSISGLWHKVKRKKSLNV